MLQQTMPPAAVTAQLQGPPRCPSSPVDVVRSCAGRPSYIEHMFDDVMMNARVCEYAGGIQAYTHMLCN